MTYLETRPKWIAARFALLRNRNAFHSRQVTSVGLGEWSVGDALGGRIGGTRLYSPASRLLNIIYCLAFFEALVVWVEEGKSSEFKLHCVGAWAA